MTDRHLTQEELYDYADGSEGAELAAHVARCEECRHRLEEINRLLSSVAQLPGEIAPPDWIWNGVVDRVGGSDEEPARSPSIAGTGTAVRGVWRRPVGLRILGRAAAVLVLVASGAVGAYLYRLNGAHARPDNGGQGSAVPPAWVAAAGPYQTADAELTRLFDERASSLSPESRLALAKSLAELDSAIDNLRRTLAAYPEQPKLQQRLVRTYVWKIKLLQRALHMTT